MRPSISVVGDCRAKVPDPPPPAIGRDAWNWLVGQHWRIMFIGLRDWTNGF